MGLRVACCQRTDHRRVISLKTRQTYRESFGFSLLRCLLNQGSPGYNVNDFYPRSSYLRDFVTTARRQGMLFGENVVPVAAYIQGVDLFEPVIQQVRQVRTWRAKDPVFASCHFQRYCTISAIITRVTLGCCGCPTEIYPMCPTVNFAPIDIVELTLSLLFRLFWI